MANLHLLFGESLVNPIDFVKMVIISALVGGLIGVERQQKMRVLAGTRTFMLTAILGTFSVIIANVLNIPNFIPASFVGIALVGVLIGYIKNIQLDDIGITTVVAFLITYSLGLLVGKAMYVEALAGSVIVTVVLVSKYNLQAFTDALTHDELVNALEFGIIAFVLYPIVPDGPIDPYGLINPRILVLIIIVVSTIGLAGFLALRMTSVEKGLPILGALGSLVNSEATASILSAKVRENKELISPALHGIILGDVVILLRNLVIVGVVSLAVLNLMLLPMLAMALIGGVYFYIKGRSRDIDREMSIQLESPFAIYPAIKFAVYITIVSVVVKAVHNLGVGGIYLASIVGGFVSSAAVTASLVSLYALGSLELNTTASACILAALGSVLIKILICKTSGTDELTKRIAIPATLIALVGFLLLVTQGMI